SHIEHIEPQEKNPQRRFDYNNLIASCNGGEACCSDNQKNSYDQLDINSCGHRKSNEFDSKLFLNPIAQTDINDYFDYNHHTAAIMPSTVMPKKAQYMIDLLNLDNQYLCNSRHNARIVLIKMAKKYNKNPQQILNSGLGTSTPFISFLQACFASK
ncbi:retron system putative HNH endonuclease, partial [Candidatus Marithrix sp. Canyon 246]